LAALIEKQCGLKTELIPSHGGVFEVVVNNELVYSKKATGEFPVEQLLVEQIVTLLNAK
jgi:selenoprotein W-related protein